MTMAVLVTNVDNSINKRQAEASISERQAEALVTLLETFQPREALKPYLMQLKAIVKDLEIDGGDMPDDVVLTCPTSTSTEISSKENENQKEDEDGTYEDCFQAVYEEPVVVADDIDADNHVNNDANNDHDHNEESGRFGASVMRTKLKPSLSFTSQASEESVGSTTVLRSESFYLDARSHHTAGDITFNNMNVKTFRMPPLSPTKRPRNKNLSPNKPPTPMQSNATIKSLSPPTRSISSPSHQSRNESRTLSQSPSRCGNRYRDTSRFLDEKSLRMEAVKEEVFDTSSILARILEFDGSLAAYHKNYDLIEGYKNPHRRRRNQSRFQRRSGTNQLAFVNKKFHSLIIGPEGLDEWKKQARQEIDTWKRIARQIMSNRTGSPSPLAKIFAIVIRNDAIEFEYLLSKHVSSIQQGNSSINNDTGSDIFGMALKEYVKGGDDNFETGRRGGDIRSMGLPHGHPFLKSLKCWQAKEFYYTTLLAELAYNAVICGAHDVLRVLSSRHNILYSTSFGPTGGQNLLGTIVAYACSQPCCLEDISQGIRTLMVGQRFGQEELHANQRGSHGNSLHLAAAKGDRELVDALLDIGYDPTTRCNEPALVRNDNDNDNNGASNDKMWYPEDWARVRGHTRVVRLLARRRKQLKQQRRQLVVRPTLSDSTAGSTQQHTADYDSITANDTVTADYDSSSSCSSDYDSDYDSEDGSETMFGEGPTFEEKTTYDEDEDSSVSEYDTEDESLLYNTDSYAAYKKQEDKKQEEPKGKIGI